MSAPRGTARRLLSQARAAGRRAEQSFGYGAGDDLSGETATARIDNRARATTRDGGSLSAGEPRWPGANRPPSSISH